MKEVFQIIFLRGTDYLWQMNIYPDPGFRFAFDGDTAPVKFDNPFDNG